MIKCKNTCPLEVFDGCCQECDQKETCKQTCSETPADCGESIVEGTELEAFQQTELAVIQEITEIVTAKKKLEELEKELKSKLKESMEKFNVKKFQSEFLNITYVAATTATTVDSKKLKEKHPEIYQECSKTSPKAAYVKVDVK